MITFSVIVIVNTIVTFNPIRTFSTPLLYTYLRLIYTIIIILDIIANIWSRLSSSITQGCVVCSSPFFFSFWIFFEWELHRYPAWETVISANQMFPFMKPMWMMIIMGDAITDDSTSTTIKLHSICTYTKHNTSRGKEFFAT